MAEATRLDKLKERLAKYYEAEMAILDGAQAYAMDGRSLTRANLKDIRDMIVYLEKEISIEGSKQSGRGRNRVIGVIPRDI